MTKRTVTQQAIHDAYIAGAASLAAALKATGHTDLDEETLVTMAARIPQMFEGEAEEYVEWSRTLVTSERAAELTA